MRVHILAKELNVSSKSIIEKCRAEGIDTVKNHMSTLSPGLHATILEWFSEGSHDTALETTERVDLRKVRLKRRRTAVPTAPPEVEEVQVESPAVETLPPDELEAPLEPSVVFDVPSPEVPVAESMPAAEQMEAPTAVAAEAPPTTVLTEQSREVPLVVAESVPTAEASPAKPSATPPSRMPVAPAGPQHVPAPAKLQGPRVVRYEAPEPDVRVGRPRPGPPQRTAVGEAPRQSPVQGQPALPPGPADASGEKSALRRKTRPSTRRVVGRVVEAGERLAEWRDRDLLERQERLAGATGRRIHHRRAVQTGPTARQAVPAGPKTRATVHEPVRVREFCSATGINFMQVFKVLREEHSMLVNINMTLPVDTAQLLALHFGIDLEVVPAQTMLDLLEEEFSKKERTNLQRRPPVVTMLGHVDHGKTSLLDAIRKARVVAGEDGGITQQIGSYHLETAHGPVTLLDTPGHEAFTAMRARGAQLTDVVVLVVAADDGVMPQTVEAINHAKAAEVPIVVALNKIDLGDQNKLKIYGQLSEHELTPSEWGGHVDVIPTSATTGTGVKELVEHLADLSELLNLTADPTLPASGTVIEAEMKTGVGSVVRLLIQEGTLRVGDSVVCGNAFGKVRAILDDCEQRIGEAGPGMPVEVWGLDDVPTAGDRLYVVDNLQRAKDVATEMKNRRTVESRLQGTKVKTLEEMFLQRDAAQIPELNLVVKADFDGSVAALRQALAEIPSDEVKLTLRHAGVGAITDSDVLLAATCRGIVVAFRVDTPVGVRRLADQHGVDIRAYRVIYDVCDDIKKALEGLLAPIERVESRGTAEIRQIFHITKVGLVAGSYVTQGTIERGHLAKVVRDGVVIREGCKFASVRRFKDDVREVRTGMECGLRLEGFDDLHVGDVIESYEIVKEARTL